MTDDGHVIYYGFMPSHGIVTRCTCGYEGHGDGSMAGAEQIAREHRQGHGLIGTGYGP